ncbi:MAG: hypothetical protein NDI82_04320, partial [Anaeromyxobacteraceae bacterium]|nr:hypothetical protein [Anaeromyxobacteraceae bacterium]
SRSVGCRDNWFRTGFTTRGASCSLTPHKDHGRAQDVHGTRPKSSRPLRPQVRTVRCRADALVTVQVALSR